jgi:hypothetical protein
MRRLLPARGGDMMPFIQFTATRSLDADQPAVRLQGNRTAIQEQ